MTCDQWNDLSIIDKLLLDGISFPEAAIIVAFIIGVAAVYVAFVYVAFVR